MAQLTASFTEHQWILLWQSQYMAAPFYSYLCNQHLLNHSYSLKLHYKILSLLVICFNYIISLMHYQILGGCEFYIFKGEFTCEINFNLCVGASSLFVLMYNIFCPQDTLATRFSLVFHNHQGDCNLLHPFHFHFTGLKHISPKW